MRFTFSDSNAYYSYKGNYSQGPLQSPSVAVRFYEKLLDRIEACIRSRVNYICGDTKSTPVSKEDYQVLLSMRERYLKRYGHALEVSIRNNA